MTTDAWCETRDERLVKLLAKYGVEARSVALGTWSVPEWAADLWFIPGPVETSRQAIYRASADPDLRSALTTIVKTLQMHEQEPGLRAYLFSIGDPDR